ncbi:MAG TPA: RecX family transcriptional regulator [Thermomicrobiales bacterium]|nr:RecX family transcriptional regulator [Thermomicrobiales bacterium]
MPQAGTITALRAQARDPERVNVFLDGRFAFGLGRQIAVDEGLRVGDVLDTTRVDTLRAADDVGKATNAALNLLARRPRSIREIRDRLHEKGYNTATIDAAVARLEGWNYVDDADFARFWVENRVAHKPRGRRLLEQELWQKGVDRETARDAVDRSELDEHDAALAIANAKIRSYAGLDRDVAYRRLGGLLARRGFGYDVVKPVLDEVLPRDGQID